MQIGNIAGGCLARIDNHHFHRRVLLARLHQTLIEHRVRPRSVRAHQHHQIAVFYVLVTARHDIFAKRAFVPHHRRRHTQPGVSVDIRRTDKSLHQFIGGVVILGQQLAGGVKRYCLRPPGFNDLPQALTGYVQRLRPCRLFALHHRA